MATRPLVSLVIPLYNEEECFEALEQALDGFIEAQQESWRFEVVLVDDGSTDATWTMVRSYAARRSYVRGVSFSRNFGHQNALFEGYRQARGEAIVCLDGDLQDPLEVVTRMLRAWEGGAEVVFAIRTRRHGETWFKRWTAYAFYRLLAFMADTDAPLDSGDFRLLDRRALNVLLRMPERHRYIRGMVGWIGFKRATVSYERQRRVAGKTKFSLRKMLAFGVDGLLSFSTFPLRLTFLFSVLGSLPFLLYAGRAFVLQALGVREMAPGWMSLLLAIVTFGSLILMAIGLVGEYVGRIYDTVKQRPDVIVRESCGLDAVRSRQVVGAATMHDMDADLVTEPQSEGPAVYFE